MAFDWTSLIGPVLGGIVGSQNGAKQAGTTTVSSEPWSPMQGFLVGGQGGAPGIADQAANLYKGASQGMPGYLQDAYTNQMNLGFGATGSPVAQALQQNTLGLLSGGGLGRNAAGNLTYTGPQQAQGGATSDPGMRSHHGAMRVNDDGSPIAASGAAGAAQPAPAGAGAPSFSVPAGSGGITASATSSRGGASGLPNTNEAYKRLLSGKVDTTAYDPMFDAASRRLTDTFQRSTMPQINRNATAAGQYGSSRQGIAQGLAAQGLGNSLSDMGANLYGNAFGQAQGNMLNAANAITGANTSLQSAAMSAGGASAAAAANERMNAARLAEDARQYDLGYGLNRFQTAGNMYNNTLGTQSNLGLGTINAANNANNYNWGQLGNYQSVIQPLAGLGGQQSQPYYTNPYAGAVGGAMMGGQVQRNLGF